MKYRNSLIFICLVIFLFNVSSVVASDASDYAADESQIEGDELSSSVNDVYEVDDEISKSGDLAATTDDNSQEEVYSPDTLKGSDEVSDVVSEGDDQKTPVDITVDENIVGSYNEELSIPIKITKDGEAVEGVNASIHFYDSDDQDLANGVVMKSDENGEILYSISSLKTGNYRLDISLDDDNYVADNVSVPVVIGKAATQLSAVYQRKNNENYLIVTLKDAKGNPLKGLSVLAMINSKSYYTALTNSIGQATFNLAKLSSNTYLANLKFKGNSYFKASSKNVDFTVVNPIDFMALDLQQGNYYYNTAEIGISIYDEKVNDLLKNKKISLKFSNGKTATVNTGSDAFAIYKIPFAPGKYTVKLAFTYAGDTLQKTYKITIKKAIPKLTAKKKTFKAKVKVKKYTITLKNNKGKVMKNAKVTLKIKNKLFHATTNAKGKATFKIKKFTKKGTFNSVVTYKGNAYYKKVAKKVKIKIK